MQETVVVKRKAQHHRRCIKDVGESLITEGALKTKIRILEAAEITGN